ncbi:MAG: ABC transporter substrate-binding protein [Methanosarcinales archaeon]|nr:ABC transporter substrate-binding protein [Methanosarcinales archaeon]
MLNKKIISLSICIVLLGAMFSGCVEERADEVKIEVPQELNIALGAGIGGLDPHGSLSGDARIIWANIYETLVYLDENMQVQPRLATSWEVSDDAKVWIFHLRENVKFHDNTPFNAEAVQFTFERHIKENPFAVGVKIQNIEVIDDYIIKFHLKEPFVPFLSELTRTRSSIISPTSVITNEFKPVGTGPFKFEEWIKEEKIVLSQNENYWGGAQPLSKIIFKIIPDAHTRVMAFDAGKIDIIGIGRGDIPPEKITRLKNDPQVTFKSKLSMNTVWLALNQENEFLQDLKVRKAINYAINPKSILEHVIEGFGEVAVAPWSPTQMFGKAPGLELPDYNPAKSQRLLTESGWIDANGDGILDKDGTPFKITLIIENRHPWRGIAEVVQSQLRNIGIDMELIELERGAFSKLLRERDFDISGISGRGLPSNDPYMHISNFYHSKYGFRIGEKAPNPSLINNPELDALIEKSISVVCPEERKNMYHRMQEIIINESVGVYLYHSLRVTALQENVKGFEISGGFWNLCLRGVRLE